MTIDWPTKLVEVSSVTPAMVASRFSSGSATVEAMMSGLAPANCACTTMSGKVTFGSGAAGRWKYASTPDNAMAIASKLGATGRLMNSDGTLTPGSRPQAPAAYGSKTAARGGRTTDKSPAW